MTTPILYDPTSPFNHLLKDMLNGWLADGHEIVRIVACESAADTGYTMGILSDALTYIRVKRKKKNKGHIFQRYLADMLTNIRMAWKMRHIKDADILFEDVSYSSFWSVRMAKKKHMRVISMLQDVWPDNAVQSGLIAPQSLMYRYFEYWQKYVYRRSDTIICISEDMKAFIQSKGVVGKKIEVIYNWGYSDKPVHIAWDDNRFVQKYALEKNVFYAVYAGNIGRMQNVEVVVRAAEELRDHPALHFLIVGGGVRRDAVAQMIEEKGLDNVTLLPLQPSGLAADIYAAASVNLIPLVPGGVKTALPSKTGVILSCGQPVVVCVDPQSGFARMIETSGAGIAVGPDDYKTLAKTIVGLAKKQTIRREDVHACFQHHFSRRRNVQRYSAVMKKQGETQT